MKPIRYADEKIGSRELMIAVPSMAIGIGIITLPYDLAKITISIDGLISIFLSGIVATILTWSIVKLASRFPNQSFYSYTSYLITKPVALLFTMLFAIQGIVLTAYEVAALAHISHQYLFDRTPREIVMLTFLLVVVYGVSGSRVGLFRLNTMFLPIILIIIAILLLFSIGFIEKKNILPVFQTEISSYMKGAFYGTLSYTGIGILFFYTSLVKDPKKAPAKAALGMGMVVFVYLFIHFTCIAVFGSETTAVLRLPTIELAKSVEIPGGFSERVESVFFVIWIMTLFTTTAMAYDVTIMAIKSVIPAINKVKIIFILAPVIYLIASIPIDYLELGKLGDWASYYGLGLSSIVLFLLSIMYWIKGRKKSGR